jgi:hypothetical protein
LAHGLEHGAHRGGRGQFELGGPFCAEAEIELSVESPHGGLPYSSASSCVSSQAASA